MAKFDDEDELQGVHALQGSGSETTASDIDEALTGLYLQTAHLILMLQECDAEDYQRYKKKLQAWLYLVEQVPKEFKPRRRLGFKVTRGRKG